MHEMTKARSWLQNLARRTVQTVRRGWERWRTTRGNNMEVRAVFELPVPVWVMNDALGATYPTGHGKLRFDVVMPNDKQPVAGSLSAQHPALEGIESHPQFIGDDVDWTRRYGGFIPASLEPATALLRVGITNVDGPTYDHAPWLTPDHQLAEHINRWFDDLRTWIEILTGQDLDPNHRVYDANFIGDGLTFIEPPHAGAIALQAMTPSVTPLRSNEWATVLTLVRNGKEPPLEEVLSRDARAAERRGASRRAIIDAATAVEIVLGRTVRAVYDQLPANQQKRVHDRTASGGYISVAKESGLELAVDPERLVWLNKLRNDAAHRGITPNPFDTANAVQLMIDFLSKHGEYKRTEKIEPDGSEWIVLDEDEDESEQNTPAAD